MYEERHGIPEKRKGNEKEDLLAYNKGVREFVNAFLKIKFTNDEKEE